LSFHLIFQAEDHTLTNDEVGKAIEKIIINLKINSMLKSDK